MALRDARPDHGRPPPGQTAGARGAEQTFCGAAFYLGPARRRIKIQAFRTFEIAPTLLTAHRYPELTSKLKAKIFGLNGGPGLRVDVPDERKKTEADLVGLRKQAYRERATPVFETFGPKNDREFEGLLAEREGLPA